MTKNVVAKVWSTLLPSFDGFKYSNYPNGDKPSGFVTVPTLLFTDTISGSLTGGENNKGAYISLFGYSFGRQADVGTTTGVKVYFRDPLGDNLWHEVDNYRALNKSRTWTRTQVMRLIVQIGAVGNPTAGRALDIKVNVGGTDSNIITGGFTVQPGRFFFVNNTTGSDTTGVVDDITKPFRFLQVWTGSVYTGIWSTTTAMGDAGLRAGDTIVIRGGTWNDQTGFDGRWARFRHSQHNGSVPNGTSGHGYISFVRYPGPILTHTPEDAHYVDPAGGKGGIHGANSAFIGTTGQYVVVSGLHGELNATTVSDGAFINFQNGGDFWRQVDCEVGPWPSTVAAPNNAKAGGIVGQGFNNFAAANYVHDIDCDHTALENHGIYIGDDGTACSKYWEVCYNWVQNIPGGSGLQFNNNSAADTFEGMKIHHNFIENSAKYGLNLANSLKTVDVYNNIVKDAKLNALRFDNNPSVVLVNVVHNTLIQTLTSGAYQYMIANTGSNLTVGTINIQHNFFVMDAAHTAGLNFTNLTSSDTAMVMAKNGYYDFAGTITSAPTRDSTGVYGNPNFTDYTNYDFTCQSGGAGIGACTDAEAFAVSVDYFGIARPVTTTSAPGATKNDIGATQGIGT